MKTIMKLQIGNGMYMNLYKNGLLPESFNDMFSLNSDLHKYSTRNKNAFSLPYCRSNITSFSLCLQGLKLFSPLSTEIQNFSSITVSTTKLKSSLLV